MSPFELVFAVYGLLLGLAIAEVLGGFSRTLKLKRGTRPVKIGWLTPLLGLLVILDLTSFWVIAWEVREQIAANYLTLIGVLSIVGIYYLAATLIFPDAPEEWPDFDDWYDKQNRLVIGGLLAANVGTWIGHIGLEIAKPTPDAELAMTESEMVVVWVGLAVLALLVALLKVKSRRWNVALLVTISALLLVFGIAEEFV
ncbi:hypothetical protein CA223_03715 [Sphingomonas koreensis]|jgi:hypothetical protein|uniref:Uncharacterized protein n=1 Tax=Sphingomonas koreensis TaxID=93064 RepID=A0A1L6JDL8_9SPHN|nr:hypothetical protein [Sphingomonas koreensis]APR54014.1 hypothetical protein BRX40_17775 [Sphingomonas koreensis]MDC7808983.1 hypothetical protein [Sphingomonas koreensis]RSU18646.1 hypothetical protein CA224_14515 [Sphingomonas koreensis]RSU25421.1 hypothetical protein CA222_11520 [Sphingomonas koreensis]RSU25842.1 hypothetical protein CA225_15475 [Sphingomonas koreensis]